MIVVGLTGGIASGKSTVSRMLRELGAPVVDADAIVHEIQGPGMPVTQAIAREFGPEVVRPDGSLDREALGRVVFADPARRKALEAIVHPAVRERMWARVDHYREAGRPAVVLDIPLLIESNLQRTVDRVWLVYVDRETQRARLMARNNITGPEADRRIA
ncbi:MAG TPA: dephospho-CoA kinase, partial [Symbiobacteriaceae bacterium]|nr:dephospho-CoA kinase [Symbiobacteriaceae bacterium]